MDRDMMDGAKERAKGIVTDMLADMRKGFNIQGQRKRRRKLSPSEQLDIFLNMSESQLDRIREEKGEREYMRYIARMNALMEE